MELNSNDTDSPLSTYIIKFKELSWEIYIFEAYKYQKTMDEINVKMGELVDVMQSDDSVIEVWELVNAGILKDLKKKP